MGRIFIGLVKCGAWGCFDEFNRLEEAVLSAVSMQIQTIQASIRTRASTTELLGREVSFSYRVSCDCQGTAHYLLLVVLLFRHCTKLTYVNWLVLSFKAHERYIHMYYSNCFQKLTAYGYVCSYCSVQCKVCIHADCCCTVCSLAALHWL